MNSPLIALESSSKSFAEKNVLQNVSMTINRGEITTIIGPNGAGKSSLVRVILGLIAPDQGNIKRAEDLVIGYMPQKIHIDPTLPISTCRFLQLANTSHDACHKALDLVGIPEVKNTPFHKLSGGEMQRALLARAILRQPNLLVLDEPVQGVDFNGQNALYGLIGELRSSLNCGIVMVSHDLHLVMSATDHVICLNHHICCQGTPAVVASAPEYRALFGSGTGGALALYRHEHDHGHDHDHDDHHHEHTRVAK